MKAIHYVLLVCGALAAGLPSLAAAFPDAATPWLKGATAVLVLLTAVLGAISPPMSRPPMPPGTGGVLGLVLCLSVALGGCNPFQRALVNAGIDDFQCFISHPNLTDDQLVTLCLDSQGKTVTAEEKAKLLDAVHQQRAALAMAAAEAHARGIAEGRMLQASGTPGTVR